jgi:putative transposase
VNWAIEEKSYSQRRACALVGMAPRVYRYQSRRPDDAGLRQRLRELSSERRRFGYRRLHLLLKREGVDVNWKRRRVITFDGVHCYGRVAFTIRKRPSHPSHTGSRSLGSNRPTSLMVDEFRPN